MKQSLWLSLALDLVQKYGVKSKPEFIAGGKLFVAKVKCLLTEMLSIKSFSDKHSLLQIFNLFQTPLSQKPQNPPVFLRQESAHEEVINECNRGKKRKKRRRMW